MSTLGGREARGVVLVNVWLCSLVVISPHAPLTLFIIEPLLSRTQLMLNDVRPNSPSVVKHGITIVMLCELHAFTLCVDPANLKLLAHCMMVVLASLFPDDFIPEVHMAVDKFMAALSLALSEKYR
uniref:Globin domain-containing protein n=1 Tax=Neogobius melanostomus TaxID=47308 RepID=A0A8C6WMI5_9GOBI